MSGEVEKWVHAQRVLGDERESVGEPIRMTLRMDPMVVYKIDRVAAVLGLSMTATGQKILARAADEAWGAAFGFPGVVWDPQNEVEVPGVSVPVVSEADVLEWVRTRKESD